MGDAVGERIDVAVGAVGECHLLGEPVFRNALVRAHQRLVDRRHQLGVVLPGDLAVVGDLADLPQLHDGGRRARHGDDLGIAADALQRFHVVGHAGARQAHHVRHGAQRMLEAFEGREIEVAVAPLQRAHAVEVVRLEPLDGVAIQRLGRAGDAEGAVVHVAAGAAGDLAQLRRRQVAMIVAVELARRREGDVVDVEIEAHADGVRRHEKIDIARLIKFDLRVARARRQRPEHNGGAAALPAHQLGDRIDLRCREGDDRRALGQAGDLLLAGIAELRQPRARDEVGAGNEIGDRLAHRLRAEQQRLGAAARVQQAVGEDVAALGIAGQLDLVDGEEVDVDVARHRLDGAHPIACPLRLDLLLAGDQRDLVGADPRGDLVVHLARQQAQRQSDHAAFVAEHALDGEVGLAGIGRAEHRRHMADARLEVAGHLASS